MDDLNKEAEHSAAEDEKGNEQEAEKENVEEKEAEETDETDDSAELEKSDESEKTEENADANESESDDESEHDEKKPVPYKRFKEVYGELKDIKKLLSEKKVADTPPVDQDKVLDNIAENLSKEQGEDEMGIRKVSKESIKVTLRLMQATQARANASSVIQNNIETFSKEYEMPLEVKKVVFDRIAKLPQEVQADPSWVETFYYESIGRNGKRAMREVERKTKEKVMKEKKILGKAAGEKSSISSESSKSGVSLTDAERNIASKLGIKPEDYAKYKEKKVGKR